MRIRHLALAALGIVGLLVVVQAILASGPGSPAPLLDDGTINVTAVEDGMGAWVPYTLTVRNLGDRDFTGRLLMVKRVAPALLPVSRVTVRGLGTFVSPVGVGGQATPPDAGYQFTVALSPRHKQTFSFYAPDDFASVLVQDGGGRQVASGEVDARKSVAVGVLTESATLAASLQAIRVGDLTMRVTAWGDANPFPDRAALLSGFSAVVLDRFESARLSRAQLTALTDFVGLGGELVSAGGPDLARTLHGLPAQLVPFAATGTAGVESLQPVADLSGLSTDITVTVAAGVAGSASSVILDAPDGRPLEVESSYGSGRVVSLLFDPDSAAAGTAAGSQLSQLALTQALGRGLESIPGSDPAGRTLLDAGALPSILFPRPSDAPFPPVALVGGLILLYLLLVVPANYFVVRRLGNPSLFWATAPILALFFSLLSYGIGQGLQAGIRDQEIQFYRVGPDGIVSRVDVHGLVFPTRGNHLLTFGTDTLVAPYTVTLPDLTASCSGCAFPGGSGAGIEEHVLGGSKLRIAERGLVYGSVRVVGSGSTETGALALTAHLGSIDDRITGTVVNTGRLPISGLLVYTYYQGGYRAALLAAGLAPGESLKVDEMPAPIGDAAPQLAPGALLTAGQAISLVADETGRRTLSHSGQVALVGFVKPADSGLRVDGLAPGGQVMAAFGMPVQLESVQGRLGEVAVPRLAGFFPEEASGLLHDTYDIALPPTTGPLVLRFDKRLYSDVEVYDWRSRTWRPGPFSQDPASGLVMLTPLDPSQVQGGLVRVRVHEISLTWGAELTVRFPGESP